MDFCRKKIDIKKLILLLFIPLALSCSSFKSGLTIPANQTFILGEFNNKNYSAELINQSELKVMVKIIEKESGVVIRSFELAPKERTKIYISKTNTVYFENENKVNVKVDVILSKGVEGMRYVDNK